MEKLARIITDQNSDAIPNQRNHNKIFMILQFLFTLPFSIIICGLLYYIQKKNNEILNILNTLTQNDLNQVEKKYRRYFSFRAQPLPIEQGYNFF